MKHSNDDRNDRSGAMDDQPGQVRLSNIIDPAARLLAANPALDAAQLDLQLAQCRRENATYLLHLVDDEGLCKVGILEKRPDGCSIFERYPVHAVNVGRGVSDSFDGLNSILNKGFKSLFSGDLNASVQVTDLVEYLQDVASGKEQCLWGMASTHPATSGDRYFLEFKRFETQPAWRNQKPSTILKWTHLAVGSVSTRDIQVNVLLGTTDQQERTSRCSLYRNLFDQHGVAYRIIAPEQ